MEYGLDKVRRQADGTRQLLARKGAALLPEDAGYLDTLGLRQLRDPAAEEAPAFGLGLRVQFGITPFFQKGPGAFRFLIDKVLFLDMQE